MKTKKKLKQQKKSYNTLAQLISIGRNHIAHIAEIVLLLAGAVVPSYAMPTDCPVPAKALYPQVQTS